MTGHMIAEGPGIVRHRQAHPVPHWRCIMAVIVSPVLRVGYSLPLEFALLQTMLDHLDK
jgi:hypothetical protein